ncbi:colorectal cancer associated 2 isoform X1 [Ictalurus furcatus]|uniref:colorectal cancer associated 2 isoform X1 n=1 Tax=Ictalurus furcatus TaxID=66913 RepID=UPI00234FD94D|nr:colorectal cancer associated 2 isoform X1 [Ictalurus furcatus]
MAFGTLRDLLLCTFFSSSPDKPKVYQGVRVKTTVKELLQKRRALQAAESRKKQAVTTHDVCSTPVTAGQLDILCGSSAQDDYFQPRQFAESVHMAMEDMFDDQLLMNMIPAENFSSSAAVCASAPAQWPHVYFPSCTEYYTNSLASSSPTHSFSLPSLVDYNSYTPPESHSTSSSCYNSPTRMDMSSSFMPESYHYQHCTLQHCFCLSHWPNLQDGTLATDYTSPHYSTSDCFYQALGEETYCRRDSSSSELCYL